MKIKKHCLSTVLSDLYGMKKYQEHLEVNREYWWLFPASDVIKYSGWYKIRITYIRSNCMFYIFPDYPEIPEQFCGVNSLLASKLIFAELDPEKDLKDLIYDRETSKIRYYFDDEHTIVHNWPNEKEIEVNDDEITIFDIINQY